MNQNVDREFVTWLHEGPEAGPTEALTRALNAVHRTSQRPGWAVRERWLPEEGWFRRGNVPRPVMLMVAAALLAVAIVAGFLVAGAIPRPAPPFGLAANGVIVVDVGSTLWRVGPDGSNPVVLDVGIDHAYSPTFSPDGTRLAFLSGPGRTGPFTIFVANADGREAVSVTGAGQVFGSELAAIGWAPDGSWIAFESVAESHRHLYVVNADGTGLRQLPDDGHDRRLAGVSPDGAWIAFQEQSLGSHTSALGIVRPDGGDARILLSVGAINASFLGTQWAPDSQRLAYFRSENGPHAVGTIDLAGVETIVSLPGEDAFNPVWSPDGTRLAYSTESSGTVVVDVGTGTRQMIPINYAECGTAWAPDGTALLGLGQSCQELFRIPLANPHAATRIALPDGVINLATWQRVAP